MKDNLFDNGVLRVIVPSGWKLFNGIDSDGNISPKKLHIYKNAQSESDIFLKAGITICFFGKNDVYLSTKAFYDNVCDIEPFECGELLWSGYTCTSFGYPYTMLESTHNGTTFQVMILNQNGEHKISLDDADVYSIIESISTSE